MGRDKCADCKEDFPFGEGLIDGLCRRCRIARRAMKEHPDEAPAAEEEKPEEEL